MEAVLRSLSERPGLAVGEPRPTCSCFWEVWGWGMPRLITYWGVQEAEFTINSFWAVGGAATLGH